MRVKSGTYGEFATTRLPRVLRASQESRAERDGDACGEWISFYSTFLAEENIITAAFFYIYFFKDSFLSAASRFTTGQPSNRGEKGGRKPHAQPLSPRRPLSPLSAHPPSTLFIAYRVTTHTQTFHHTPRVRFFLVKKSQIRVASRRVFFFFFLLREEAEVVVRGAHVKSGGVGCEGDAVHGLLGHVPRLDHLPLPLDVTARG